MGKSKKTIVGLSALTVGAALTVYGFSLKGALSDRYTFSGHLTSVETSVYAALIVGVSLLIVGLLVFVSIIYQSRTTTDCSSDQSLYRTCPICKTRISNSVQVCPVCDHVIVRKD